MRSLITGAAGFIGSHILEAVDGIGIDNYSTGTFQDERIIKGDIRTFNFEQLDIPDVIFHVAAKASIPDSIEDPYDSHDNTVNGMLRVLDYARKHKIPVVYSASSSVYDDDMNESPMTPYALQKYIGEQYLRVYHKVYGLKSVALRYFSVYGERQPDYGSYQTVMSIFMKQKKEGKPFTITGTGKQRRDFVYVKDVVAANLLAASMVTGCEQYDVGTGTNYSVNEVAGMIASSNTIEPLPPRIEPFITQCNKDKWIPGWEPKMQLPIWLKSQ